ncbi:MAG: TIGR03086 family metal-binding protein [Dermatophilaceae bacterium]
MTTDAPPPTDHQATAAETRNVLLAIADLLDALPAGADADPTPCTDYSVADLREHIVSWSTAFGAGFRDPGGHAPDAAAVQVEGTGSAQVRAAGEAIAAGIAAGGAERDLTLADGNAMPGAMALAMTLWEYQVHGWDLAVATGQVWAPAPEAVDGSIGFAEQMLTPDFQGEGLAFAPRVPVPADAPAIERLVGMSGRDPQWAPPA